MPRLAAAITYNQTIFSVACFDDRRAENDGFQNPGAGGMIHGSKAAVIAS